MFNVGDFVLPVTWINLQGIQAKLKKSKEMMDQIIKAMFVQHEALTEERKGRTVRGCPMLTSKVSLQVFSVYLLAISLIPVNIYYYVLCRGFCHQLFHVLDLS